MDRPLAERSVPGAVHPLPAASLLAGLRGRGPFVLFETGVGDRRRPPSRLYTGPVEIITTAAAGEVERCFSRLEEALRDGLHLAGFFSYELGCLLEASLSGLHREGPPLLWFGAFREPLLFRHADGSFAPALPFPLPSVGPGGGACAVRDVRFDTSREEYTSAVGEVRRRIAAGDTYQVNYTMRCRFALDDPAEALYLTMRANQPAPYAAFIRTGSRDVLSASPELFFERDGDHIECRPMKGTIRRGRGLTEDRELAETLSRDAKNRAENIMIVDLIRNDLGRICQPGSVVTDRLFRIESLDSLHQMTSTVRGRLKAPLPIKSLLSALFPCGSVTGAPKIRTMEIIAALEKSARGVYCGAVGFFAPESRAVFSVPIRTAVVENGRGELGLGSGIVADSNAAAEYEECLLKGKFFLEPLPALGLIETLLWTGAEGYAYLEGHLARLAESAAFFAIPFSGQTARRSLLDFTGELDGSLPHRVRLVLAREGDMKITAAPLSFVSGPKRVRLSREPTDSADIHLYHKTTRRERYDGDLEAARREGFFEILYANERGELTEGAFTNLFIETAEGLATPPVTCGLLNGVLRRHLLSDLKGGVLERVLRPGDLHRGGRVFVGNSVRGLVEVEPE